MGIPSLSISRSLFYKSTISLSIFLTLSFSPSHCKSYQQYADAFRSVARLSEYFCLNFKLLYVCFFFSFSFCLHLSSSSFLKHSTITLINVLKVCVSFVFRLKFWSNRIRSYLFSYAQKTQNHSKNETQKNRWLLYA